MNARTKRSGLQEQPLRGAWRNALAQLPYLSRGLGVVWVAARGWTIAWAGLLIAQGLLPVATVYLTRAVVNGLVGAVEAIRGGAQPWTVLGPTLGLVAALAAVALLIEVLRSIAGWVRTTQADLVRDHISALIHAKATSVDLAVYETPEYYDRLFRARTDAANRPIALLENVGSLAQSGLTLIAMAGVLLPFGAWLPAALLVSTLPAFAVVLRYSLREHQWRMRNTPVERRAQYYDWLQTFQGAAAELRLFALGEHFRRSFQDLRARLRGERAQIARDQAVAEITASGAGLVTTAFAVGWMVWRAAHGLATLGDVALLYQAFNQGQRLMRTLLQSVGQVYANSLFLENLFVFLSLEPTIVDPPQPAPAPATLLEGIRLEHVTFRYPGSARPALDGFSLTVPAGRVVAIVGANGAGKSTLIKLLCRFYDPDAGRVLLDGRDLRDLSLDELRRRFTVLFQQPLHHQDTARRNIAFGDLASAPAAADIEAAAHAAGADVPIARLPDAYETLLGKWFGGAELSVGEWQRVALARAFLRRAPIVLLDEPTSAMDSWAEADWMERFRALVAGRTAIMITHRFTTAMRADAIHVMEDGRVVESGTHEQLVARGGLYSESWARQMKGRATPPADVRAPQPIKARGG
jgi:ATP-binding cassette subfamily B protein